MKIIRNKLCIMQYNLIIPSEGSVNVKLEIESDGSYSDYVTEVHVGYFYKGSPKEVMLNYQDGYYLIPGEIFVCPGPVSFACHLSKDNEKLVTNTLVYFVKAAPGGTIVLPSTETWEAAVNSFLESWSDQFSNQVNSLRNSFGDLNSKMDVLDSRMDTMTSLPVGSTIGDAELADIRVGFDGKTYENAGSAVRGQVSQLSSEIEDISYYDIVFSDGVFYNKDSGKILTSSAYSASNLLDCAYVEKIIIYTCANNDDTGVVFFDKNDNLISSTNLSIEDVGVSVERYEVNVPKGSYKFGFSCKTSYKTSSKAYMIAFSQALSNISNHINSEINNVNSKLGYISASTSKNLLLSDNPYIDYKYHNVMSENYNLNVISGIVNIDNSILFRGNNTIKCVLNDDNLISSFQLRFIKPIDLLGTQEFDIAIYIDDVSKINSIKVKVSNTKNDGTNVASSSLIVSKGIDQLKNGWSLLRGRSSAKITEYWEKMTILGIEINAIESTNIYRLY